MRRLFYVMWIAPLFAAACMSSETSGSGNSMAPGSAKQVFNIAAKTVPCEGVAPMQCLVVNGEFFYDPIDGYEHVEGQAAQICVLRTERPKPIPADLGQFQYRRVACE